MQQRIYAKDSPRSSSQVHRSIYALENTAKVLQIVESPVDPVVALNQIVDFFNDLQDYLVVQKF